MLLLMWKMVPVWIFLQLGFGVISTMQKAFLMLKVFNPSASSYQGSQVSSSYCRFEKDKRQRGFVRLPEMASPVFSTRSGGSYE